MSGTIYSAFISQRQGWTTPICESTQLLVHAHWQDADMLYFTWPRRHFCSQQQRYSLLMPVAPTGWLSAEWQQLCICNKSHCDPFVFCFYCALPAWSSHSSKVAICCHDSRYCAGCGPHFSRAPAPGSSPTLPPCVPLISRVSSLSFLFYSRWPLFARLGDICCFSDAIRCVSSELNASPRTCFELWHSLIV